MMSIADSKISSYISNFNTDKKYSASQIAKISLFYHKTNKIEIFYFTFVFEYFSMTSVHICNQTKVFFKRMEY